MKKVLLSVAAVFAFGFANAQDSNAGSAGLSKGDLYLSGTLNFSSEKTGDLKSDTFTVAPGLGYMLTENIAFEGSLGYVSGTSNQFAGGNFVEVKNSGFGINAGVKYFWTPASNFSLSLGGNISYASVKTEVDAFGTDYTSKVIGVNAPVGLHYFVSDNIALTSTWGGLGYTSNDNGGNGADKTNAFELGLDLSAITFGMIYKL